MDPERWERVRSVFAGALERAPGDRARFLEEACAGDEQVLREARSLLAEDEEPDALLSGAAADLLSEALSPVGRSVGPWRIERELGAGGMGAVYLAERADGQFEQRVALKVIRRGLDSETILRRFRDERTILAQLDHPNIARLLDGGATEDGLPYFTMEFVDGVSIDRFCDDNGLPIPDRLELFRTVCAAVHHAHRNLVVHRDLKPGNILVTSDGIVKLLDFGIAKVLGGGTEDPGATRTGMRAMTPAYASPEQVRGEAVTTASDVYSLGVLLYELLSGRRPFDAEGSTPAELERSIRTTAPERPSLAVDRPPTGGTAPGDLARARGSTPAQVRRALAGDLDNICLAALRKEPERRYGSAEALSEDVRRHLRGLPVTARPDTVGYRFRKFLGRNRVGVGAGVAVVATLAALAAFYTARLSAERDRARLEARKAERVSGFLAGLFQVSDPRESGGETVTAREILDLGSGRLEEELAGEPEVLAEMAAVVGQVYGSLGLYDEARPWLERSLELREGLFQETHPALLESMHRLGGLDYETGALEEARVRLRDTLARRVEALGPDHPDVAETASHLGKVLLEIDSLAAAEELHRDALRIRSAAFGEDHLLVAESLTNLGQSIFDTRRHEVEPLYRRALEIREAELGDRHADLAVSMQNLALVHEAAGKREEAAALYRRAVDMDRDILGQDHPQRAATLTNLGRLLGTMGHYEEGAALLREAAELERLRGENHSYVGYTLKELGKVLRDGGNLEEADATFREALRVYSVALPQGGFYVASTQTNYGRLLMEMGRLEEAEVQLREGARTYGGMPPDASSRIRSEASWGECLGRMGRFAPAESLLVNAYGRALAGAGRPSPGVRWIAEKLVRLYEDSGREQSAAPYREMVQAPPAASN